MKVEPLEVFLPESARIPASSARAGPSDRWSERACFWGAPRPKAIKRSVQETEGLPEAAALALELEIGQPVFASEDAREGLNAYVEKRPAKFTGK